MILKEEADNKHVPCTALYHFYTQSRRQELMKTCTKSPTISYLAPYSFVLEQVLPSLLVKSISFFVKMLGIRGKRQLLEMALSPFKNIYEVEIGLLSSITSCFLIKFSACSYVL